MRDRKTGEKIRPFGYDLDQHGRPIRRRIDLSQPSHDPNWRPTICASCDRKLNENGDCEACMSGRQG